MGSKKKKKKLAENQEEILKNSNIEDSIKFPSNKIHTTILHENNKKKDNNSIFRLRIMIKI